MLHEAHSIAPPPTISAPDSQADRPLISVAVPTYRPSEKLLVALQSVLHETASLPQLEILVVDDSPLEAAVEQQLRTIDPEGRIAYHHNATRLGIGGNWNRAIELSRGTWIHLLHQDDHILPGFYRQLAPALESSVSFGMAFCRTRIIDQHGSWRKTSSRLAWRTGQLRGWLATISVRQRLQTPGVIVRRSVYESLGGFRSDLRQTLDWEMWVRIAAAYPVWYTTSALAAYRRHSQSETSRNFAAGSYWQEIGKAIAFNSLRLPYEQRVDVIAQSLEWHRRSALRSARRQLAEGQMEAARQSVQAATSFAEMARTRQDLSSTLLAAFLGNWGQSGMGRVA
jgi:glycosyltransferase involved in cell wall biosynthesis